MKLKAFSEASWHWSCVIIHLKLTYAIIQCYWIFLSTLEMMWSCLLREGLLLISQAATKQLPLYMVNKLGLEIEQNTSCYHELAQQLNDYYDNDCNCNMGSLRTIYFGDIWRGCNFYWGHSPACNFLEFLKAFCPQEYLRIFFVILSNSWKIGNCLYLYSVLSICLVCDILSFLESSNL